MAEEAKKITLGLIVSWIFGVMFGISGLMFALEGSLGAGIPLVIASIVLLPPINAFFKDKFNFELSRGLKVVVVIILFAVYAVNMSSEEILASSSDDVTVLEGDEITQFNPAKETNISKVYNFGDRVVVGNFAYTFHDMTLTDEVGEYIAGQFLGTRADGIFIVLDVTIENIGKETIHLSGNTVKIVDEQDRKYDHDGSAEIHLSDEMFTFAQMQPGLPKRGKIIFDVPKNIMGLFEISGDSLFSNEKAYVSFKK